MPPLEPTLTLTVQPIYLALLRSGEKTHEGRLARPKYLSLQPGNYIKIASAGTQNTKLGEEHDDASIFQVHSVMQYETFREMLSGHGVQAFLPGLKDLDEGVEVYRAFPGYTEGEDELGVVAIEVTLVTK